MRKMLLMLAALAALGWTAAQAADADRDKPWRGPRGGSVRGRNGDRDEDRDDRRGPPRRGPPGPGRHGFDRRHVPPMFQKLTDEQVEEILAFVKEKMPWRYERLKTLQEEDPDAFRRTCWRLRFEIGQLQRLKKDNPDAYEAALEEHRLRARADALAEQARRAESDAAREKAVAELRGVLYRLFDAEGKAREAQIRQFEERIRHLREQLAQRARQRDRIVDWLLERMLSGRQDKGKGAGPPPPPPSPEP